MTLTKVRNIIYIHFKRLCMHLCTRFCSTVPVDFGGSRAALGIHPKSPTLPYRTKVECGDILVLLIYFWGEELGYNIIANQAHV